MFTGEEMPRRAVLPERLVPSLPGLFGSERVESERVRLANVGQPLREQPVGVSHSANMADLINGRIRCAVTHTIPLIRCTASLG